MASASNIIEDIDDKFCQCCLCFEQYKDPRQLPCLHRYCAGCLQKLINKTEGDIKCPLCQEPVDVPKEGAQGLKKDFYMNEIIDYVKVKKSLEDDKVHNCGDCSKTVKASAYCFRCSDFLCNDCHEYHLTRKSLREHKPHILTLGDVESKNITLEKLSSLKEAPRCGAHPDKVADLCCKSCSNLPICVSCTYGKHKGHQIEEVVALAETEKERLRQKLGPLHICKDNVYQTSKKLETVQKGVGENASRHKSDLTSRYQSNLAKVEQTRRSILEKLAAHENEIEQERKEKATMRAREMDRKIKQIKMEYQKKSEMDGKEIETKLTKIREGSKAEEQEVATKEKSLKDEFMVNSERIEEQQKNKREESEAISQHLNHTIQRYENLTRISSNILVSKNSWTVVQNVDNICSATEPLLQDMKREFTELDRMPEYNNVGMGAVGWKKNVRLPQQAEHVVHIEGIKANGCCLNGMTRTKNGDVVISGGAEHQSFITAITTQGKRVKHQLIKPKYPKYSNPVCYCAPFNESNVATACQPDEVGLFDFRDQSYSRKSLREIIPGVSSDYLVTCITTDEANNHVLVGCGSTRDVYVLDDQLDHHSTITLPDMIRWPRDITGIDRHLIVCDKDGKRACAVNMKGELEYEFTKPGDKGCDIPLSVCTDSSGFIYILWVVGWPPSDQNCVVAQYSQDDHRLLSKTSMYTDAWCMTIAETDQTEKLLVATFLSGKLHVYDLEDVDGLRD